MRFIFIVLGIIAAALALLLAVTSLSQLAYFPAVAALIFGGLAFYLSKPEKTSKKSVHLIFLLTVISLLLTTYKAIFNTTEVGNFDELELNEDASNIKSEGTLDDIDSDTTELDIFETEEVHDLEDLEDQ